ncbi:reverse transcriptase [Plakobranchus ocellatus]|uniref:Reverse transcriptase n=1 Tax=Plakobranchus ocellatus TaxID=259542 RepID=A0AAV3ZKX2_9GAST|nr:reverse transcriptase [Plakobranchus ocellatus]
MPVCQGEQTTEHVLSSCKVALSQGRYTWRYKKVLQGLAISICDAKGLLVQPKARAPVLKAEGGTKSWCGSAANVDTERKVYWMSVTTGIFKSIYPNGIDI